MGETGPIASLAQTVRAKVAGKPVFTIIYYLVLLIALALFVLGAISIIAPVIRGEDVTSVETKFLPEITFPVIFMCLSETATKGINSVGGHITAGNRDNTVCGSNARITGRLESTLDIASNPPTCLTVYDKNAPGTSKNLAILNKLLKAFRSESCVLMNTEGTFKSRLDARREMIVSFNQDKSVVGSELYGIIGLYDQGTEPFNENGDLTAEFFRSGFQNTLSSTGLQVDTIIDRRRASLIALPPSISEVTGFSGDNKKVTPFYSITTASTTRYSEYVPLPSTTGTKWAGSVVADGSMTGPQSDYHFYISSFVTREITLRTRSFAEVWALLGGAMASAFVVVTWFFREEVVKSSTTDGATEKVQVFRFKSLASAKQEALDLVKSLDSTEAPTTPDALELVKTENDSLY